jgi:SAM-dependent methyltransferase
MKNINQYDKELTDEYNKSSRTTHPHQLISYKTWIDAMGSISGKKVLEFACGSGLSTRMLSSLGAKVTGVDLSKEMLELARKQSDNQSEFINSDASIPRKFDENGFDLVVSAFLLHYASSLQVLEGFVSNISLNLKSGCMYYGLNISPDHPIILPQKGISHSSVWEGEPWKDGARMKVTLWSKNDKESCQFMTYHWNRDTYEKVLEKFGMKILEWIEIDGSKPTNNMLVVIKAVKLEK